MTKLEQEIVDFLDGRKSRTVTAHTMSHHVGRKRHYGPKGKQIVGMAVGRMRKKGIDFNWGAMK